MVSTGLLSRALDTFNRCEELVLLYSILDDKSSKYSKIYVSHIYRYPHHIRIIFLYSKHIENLKKKRKNKVYKT